MLTQLKQAEILPKYLPIELQLISKPPLLQLKLLDGVMLTRTTPILRKLHD